MKIRFSIPITSMEVCFATGAKFNGEKRVFTHLSTSSCDTDEETLFFALQGKRTSGEEFVKELAHKKICSVSKQSGEFIFTHSSPVDALLKLAHYYKGKLKSLQKTIAITGSVGKTTTKEFIKRILSQKWKVHANEGNYNSEIGVPLTIFTTPVDCEYLILEFGMNHSGEIQKLSNCAFPDFGVITNIGHAHIGNLGSRFAIAKEKMDICSHKTNMQVLVDANEPLLSSLKHRIQLFSDIIIQEETQNSLMLSYKNDNYYFKMPVLPYDTRLCLLFAISVGILFGLNNEELQEGIDLCLSIPVRRKEIKLGGFKLIDDTYNASPESVDSAISFLMTQQAKRKYIVLGDMLELGEYTKELHTLVGNALAKASLDGIYLFGEFGIYTKEGLNSMGYNMNQVFLFDDTRNYEGLICALSNQLNQGDVCLLKGSNASKMWRITEGLEEVYS